MVAEPGRLGSEAGPDPQSPQEQGDPAEQDASAQPAQEEDQADGQPSEEESEEEQDAAPDATKRVRRSRPFWRELAVIVVAALVLTILLKAFVVQVFSIPTGSMENTLIPGDRVLVNKLVYRFRPIERGDIVVFSGAGSWDPPASPPSSNPVVRILDDVRNLVGVSAPGTDYIKRVIGVPGDHVVCCNAQGKVTVNGVPLNEGSYIYPGDAPSQITFNIKVPSGRLWVMGDDRADSDDSRYRMTDPGGGTIPESAVVGRAFIIIWPASRWSDLPIPGTFQQKALQAAALATTPAGSVASSAVVGTGLLTWRRRRRRQRERSEQS